MSYLNSFLKKFDQSWLEDKTDIINYDSDAFPFEVDGEYYKTVNEYVEAQGETDFTPHSYYVALIAKAEQYMSFANRIREFDAYIIPEGYQRRTILLVKNCIEQIQRH